MSYQRYERNPIQEQQLLIIEVLVLTARHRYSTFIAFLFQPVFEREFIVLTIDLEIVVATESLVLLLPELQDHALFIAFSIEIIILI